MSHSSKPSNAALEPLGLDSLRDSLSSPDSNKPDFRELRLDSPVSPLRPRVSATAPTTSSSSSSSGSGGAHPVNHRSSHSGELTIPKPGQQCRSEPLIYYSGGGGGGSQSCVTSPVSSNVLPTGNICPSGKILKSGLNTSTNRSTKTDVLGSGTGNYGHGSIMRGGGVAGTAKCSSNSCCSSSGSVHLDRGGLNPEELKRIGNEMHKKGQFAEALGMYDKAILLAPRNAAYRSNRAAALIGLGRIGEAVRDCEEAVRLDPNYGRAHQRLGALLIR